MTLDHQSTDNDDDLDEEIRIRPCRECWGEGCNDCDNTGVIYP